MQSIFDLLTNWRQLDRFLFTHIYNKTISFGIRSFIRRGDEVQQRGMVGVDIENC